MMFKIFGQKNRTLEDRRIALADQINQLKNESIKSNTQIRLLELAPKGGLSPNYDYTKQTD